MEYKVKVLLRESLTSHNGKQYMPDGKQTLELGKDSLTIQPDMHIKFSQITDYGYMNRQLRFRHSNPSVLRYVLMAGNDADIYAVVQAFQKAGVKTTKKAKRRGSKTIWRTVGFMAAGSVVLLLVLLLFAYLYTH